MESARAGGGIGSAPRAKVDYRGVYPAWPPGFTPTHRPKTCAEAKRVLNEYKTTTMRAMKDCGTTCMTVAQLIVFERLFKAQFPAGMSLWCGVGRGGCMSAGQQAGRGGAGVLTQCHRVRTQES